MEIEDAWYFNIHNLRQGDEIGCPICKVYRPHQTWEETLIGGTCATLFAIVCPSCGRTFDYLNDAQLDFKVRSAVE